MIKSYSTEKIFEKRQYQLDAVEKARYNVGLGHKHIIIHAPTGSGKTKIASDITMLGRAKKKKILFLANRRELIFQAKGTLEETGLTCGLIMAGEPHNHDADIQVASMQTYIRRMDLDELKFNRWWHDADIIFVDECHTSISPSYMKILQAYGDRAVVIGLTATPCRSDGRGLGEYYSKIVKTVGIGELIKLGYLVPFRYFAPTLPDYSDAPPLVNGDYAIGYLGQKLNQKKLIGDIYDNWSQICPDRPTIIFATTIAHSIALQQQFLSRGIEARHLDHKTPKDYRADSLDRFNNGRLQVLVNHGILCEGTDLPPAACIILARGTKSLGRYIQMGGRGSRTSEETGKIDCIILDHGGCINEHGFLETDYEWTLDGKKKAWQKQAVEAEEHKPMICSACGAVMDGLTICPDCGSPMKKYGKMREVEDGELKEVGKKEFTMADKRQFYGMCEFYRIEKGYSAGWASHKYRDKFGVWPHQVQDTIPIQPDQKFLNWITYCNIKHAKSKGKHA